jgi:solute carrier family 50 protein (sugar transporter)
VRTWSVCDLLTSDTETDQATDRPDDCSTATDAMGLFLEGLRLLTTVSSLLLTVSPWPEFRGILAAKSTGPLTVLPIVMLFCNSYMWTVYGFLVGQIFPLIATCSTGQCTSAFFIGVYYKYSDDRAAVRRVLLGVSDVLVHQPYDSIVRAQGVMAIIANLCLYAAPLDTMVRVVRLRNAESLPISLCAVNLLNGVLWVAFGLTEGDYFVLTPNAIGSVLSAAQVALYLKFPPVKGDSGSATLPVTKKTTPTFSVPPANYDTMTHKREAVAIHVGPVQEHERQPLLVPAAAN